MNLDPTLTDLTCIRKVPFIHQQHVAFHNIRKNVNIEKCSQKNSFQFLHAIIPTFLPNILLLLKEGTSNVHFMYEICWWKKFLK